MYLKPKFVLLKFILLGSTP